MPADVFDLKMANQDRLADAAFKRILGHFSAEANRKRLVEDWMPLIDNVHAHSMRAWESAGSPTKLDGSPNWQVGALQDAFRSRVRPGPDGFGGNRPWADWLYARPEMLSVFRSIGANKDAFLKWYETLPEDERESLNYPPALWKAFRDRTQPKAERQPSQAKAVAEEERQAQAARMDDLDGANNALMVATGCRIEHDESGTVKVSFPDPATLIERIRAQGNAYVAEFDRLWSGRDDE